MPATDIHSILKQEANEKNLELSSVQLAEELDAKDELRHFRNEFFIPLRRHVSTDSPVIDSEDDLDKPCTYLCGNSLGLMPKRTKTLVQEELDVWANRGVEGHWNHPYGRAWAPIDEIVKESLGRIVGAKPSEVTAMNTLTSNLHSMMVSFYQPTPAKFKIVIEAKAFPSDHYATASQIQIHGYDPTIGLVTIAPRPGESVLRTEDIIDVIRGDDQIALVLLSGVQYYTGQYFEIEKITKAAHEKGCMVGWDLAHAVGNVPLQLHDWNVDFACWCSYKYLNSGPGGIGGLFIHEKHGNDTSRPRFAGWWGNEKSNRFEMKPEFRPSPGASGYQLSNPSVLNMVCLAGSLSLFDEATIPHLRQKSLKLTGYLELLLLTVLKQHHNDGHFSIITPSQVDHRGCQLSLDFPKDMMAVFDGLQKHGVICDERKPTVIRIAPTPLYNSFTDVHRAVMCLKKVMDAIFYP